MSVAIESLIPHRAPMRWIDALIECTATTAVAGACFAEGDYAVSDGRVLESALVECMAQTVAAAMGQRAQSGGGKGGAGQQGMLVAASNFKILRPAAAGEALRIEVRENKRLGPMLLIAGSISSGGEMIATGELSLYA